MGGWFFFLAVLCRLQMDEELRQREREREREREKEREREADREREKEREREREREKELEREREKERERERELERQRERAREKELSMVKAMEGPFLPVAELHGLRGHPAEERSKAAEPLAPSRPGNIPTGDMGGPPPSAQLTTVPRWQSRGGRLVAPGGGWGWSCQLTVPEAQLLWLLARRCLCHLTRSRGAPCPVRGWQPLRAVQAGDSRALAGSYPTALGVRHPQTPRIPW